MDNWEKEDLCNLDYINDIIQQIFNFPSYVDVTRLFDNDIQLINDDLSKIYFKTNRFKLGIYSETDLLDFKERLIIFNEDYFESMKRF